MLRWYQQEAVDAVNRATGSTLVVLPTGSGKTHVIGGIAASNPDASLLIVSHTKDILEQDEDKLKAYVDPSLVSIYSAGLGRKEHNKYCVAGIQSIYNKAEECQRYDIVIVDEVHMIPASGNGRYRTFLAGMQDKRIIGLTATPYRLEHGPITKDHLFQEIAYEADIPRLIEEGFLCPLKSKETKACMDLSGITLVGGDYAKKELSDRVDTLVMTASICGELHTHYRHRKKWLVFAIDIAHAEHITQELVLRGFAAACIHSRQPAEVQQAAKADYRAGRIQALVSVETLTTGFDVPDVDLIVLLRPTTSPVLHVQMIGRGFRVHPAKTDCLVLDFAGNIARLGPVNDLCSTWDKSEKREGKKEAPTKACPRCQEIVSIQTKTCPDCGYMFAGAGKKLELQASALDVVATAKKEPAKGLILPYNVTAVFYSQHTAKGKLPSLKVTYQCGMKQFYEWKAVEAEGYPRVLAKSWWQFRDPVKQYMPVTVKEALVHAARLRKPKKIYVTVFKKYPEIVRYEF